MQLSVARGYLRDILREMDALPAWSFVASCMVLVACGARSGLLGGDPPGTAGTAGSGGALAGSGGALAGSGGATAGSDGALAGSGGALAGSGGATAGSGGALAGSGGATAGGSGQVECQRNADCRLSCAVGRCTRGICSYSATNCDDGNGCTTDSCEPQGGCVHTPISPDLDGDGFASRVGACGSDCNDSNALIFPGAAEICDGVDNDCNGLIDELLAAPAVQVADAELVGPLGLALLALDTGFVCLVQGKPASSGGLSPSLHFFDQDGLRGWSHALGSDAAFSLDRVSGLLFVTQQQLALNPSDVWISTFSQGGDVGPSAMVASFAASPFVAASDDSSLLVAWQSASAPTSALASRLNSTGAVLNTAIQLTTDVSELRAAAAGGGRWGLSYFSQGTSALMFQTFSLDLSAAAAPTLVAANPSASALLWAGDHFLQLWSTSSSAGTELWGAEFGADGDRLSANLKLDVSATAGLEFAAVADGDSIAIVWSQAATVSGKTDLVLRRFAADLGPGQVETHLFTSTALRPASIARAPDGRFGVLFDGDNLSLSSPLAELLITGCIP